MCKGTQNKLSHLTTQFDHKINLGLGLFLNSFILVIGLKTRALSVWQIACSSQCARITFAGKFFYATNALTPCKLEQLKIWNGRATERFVSYSIRSRLTAYIYDSISSQQVNWRINELSHDRLIQGALPLGSLARYEWMSALLQTRMVHITYRI